MTGFLKLIIGPMYSGKTTALINIYKSLISQNKNHMVINYIDDKRYHDTLLSSHDKVKIPCLQMRNITDIFSFTSLEKIDVILINEGQFFDDLKKSVIKLVNMGKYVYVCGLDGDFRRNKFGQILDLIPFCDEIEKLYSICHNCSNKAPFTKRITEEEGQVVIGSSNYVPLCRNCYDNCLMKK
tara:strand:+ start:5314 stop:5862 length:549 start_codon:yes stop_codon:yes gene_type:complete